MIRLFFDHEEHEGHEEEQNARSLVFTLRALRVLRGEKPLFRLNIASCLPYTAPSVSGGLWLCSMGLCPAERGRAPVTLISCRVAATNNYRKRRAFLSPGKIKG
jgi:hypothetical protein